LGTWYLMDNLVDMSRAQRMIEFIEKLTVPEGMHQGEPFVLRPWQKKIIIRVYSPVDENGLRIVRKAILSMGKKNGKTPLIAAMALCHLIGPEAKRNEQMNSAAFERDQAGIVYKYMANMINADEDLKKLTIIRTTKKEIEGRYTGSIYKALSAEAKSKHGISPAFLAFDELAQFGADRVFYDTLTQGFGAHDEPMLWIISTQAEDDLAVLSQEIDYALKSKDDPSVVLFFYTTPSEDEDGNETDLMDRESWKLSNPALDDFLSLKDMESKARTAVDMPTSEPGFRNLRLNQRVASSSRFMSPALWKKNGAAPNPDALAKGRIMAGLDLSQKNDLSALVLDAFYEGEHNIFPFFWRPLDNIQAAEKKDRVPYVLWHKQGLLEAKPGEVIDFRYIAEKVFEIHMLYGISQLNYDRYFIKDLILILNSLGCDTHIKDKEEPKTDKSLCIFDHGQGTKSMTPAITYLEDAFIEKRVRHGNNPILTMCAANAKTLDDATKGKRFEKDKSTGKIDGLVAMTMAMNGVELPDEGPKEQPMPVFL